MPKDRIIAALGEQELLLPELVSRALSANDRVKYVLTLLQTARSAADGDQASLDLRDERMAAGVADAELDRVVGDSTRTADGAYAIPGAAQLVRHALADVDAMLLPLHESGSAAAPSLEARAREVRDAVALDGDVIAPRDISRLTAGRHGGEDSLHLVVMDAHRELNRLQERLSTESIDGAHAYGITDDDRPLVAAFARGVQRTQRLRFDHPGLGTVATRSGDALVIQNDIGETDAHVVVIRVAQESVTVTYTDVHLARLLFFQRMLGGRGMAWEDTRSRSTDDRHDDLYHLAVGRTAASSRPELEAFLEYLGSRMVFLIDWNRARKRLRGLVGNRSAIELLGWSAAHEHGHMAFLRAGGDQLVYDALNFATGHAAAAGDSLVDALGEEGAVSYLRSVLSICAQGLLAGRSLSLVRDEVLTDLIGYVRTARQQLLELIGAHAELVVALAEGAQDALEQALVPRPDADREAIAATARAWERRADELVNDVRTGASRAEDPAPFVDLAETADDVADELEEAAYYWTLLPAGRISGRLGAESRRMSTLVLASARTYLRALVLARDVQRGGSRGGMDDFLQATDRIVALERETDDVERRVTAAVVAEVERAADLFVLVEATRACERAADALMHAAHLLHRQVLGEVVRAQPTIERAAAPAVSGVPKRVEGEIPTDVYVIGDDAAPIPDLETIGAKARGLARMSRAGLPVPDAVVLGTALSRRVAEGAGREDHRSLVASAVALLQARTGLQLGSARQPLVLSVRSGAPMSMPGALETVLDVGLCDDSVNGLVAMTGNPRLAWDSYRRLVESYAHVVEGCPLEPFEAATRRRLAAAGVSRPRDLDAEALAALTREHLERFGDLTSKPFPQDPIEQTVAAVGAVLDSWHAPKAREYRRLRGLPELPGTAVILQRMVFGNAGGISGAGVGFTRNPVTGEARMYADFLLDAQGEDIVGGRQAIDGANDLALFAPEVYARMIDVCAALEREFGDAQDFEFTVQDGELFLLQTRGAKRTPWAALHILVDQVAEGLVSESDARERLAGLDLPSIRRTRVAASDGAEPIGHALPASMGVAAGPIALDSEAAQRIAGEGRTPVLVRPDTTTDDLPGLVVSAGVLTARGGRTSHAAVIARELAKPCLVACAELDIDLVSRRARIGEREFAEGDEICLDGESGLVFAGAPALAEERPTAELAAAAAWGPSS